MSLRHEPTDDCTGHPLTVVVGGNRVNAPACPECEQELCPCETAYGHDCEGPEHFGPESITRHFRALL